MLDTKHALSQIVPLGAGVVTVIRLLCLRISRHLLIGMTVLAVTPATAAFVHPAIEQIKGCVHVLCEERTAM